MERRAAQTTMYEILSALVRILAPMTCFTAEEIWKYMPHRNSENSESVMLDYYPKVNAKFENEALELKWGRLMKIKEAVSKKLEKARAEKEIGLSLEAKVILYAEAEEYDFIKDKTDLLKDICMVSGVEISENRRNQDEEVGIGIEVKKADGEKCERCWEYSRSGCSLGPHPVSSLQWHGHLSPPPG